MSDTLRMICRSDGIGQTICVGVFRPDAAQVLVLMR